MSRPSCDEQSSEKEMKWEEGVRRKIWSLKKMMKMKKKDLHMHLHLTSSVFKWKRVKDIQHSFIDNVVFKVVSVCEGVVLVSTVCVFFVCCGCQF